MDLIGHLLAIDCGNDAIYTVVGRLSKFIYFILCRHTISAANLAQLFLANIVAHHGMPASIISNYDPQFTSYFWYSLISALYYKHSLSMALHPEMDGLSERMDRFIE